MANFPGYLIYKATSPSGKVYVGLTSQSLRQRKHQHENHAPKSNGYFQKALVKYREAMVWETLDNNIADFEKAAERERYFIGFYQSNNPVKGYNSTTGGDVGRPPRKPSNQEKRPVLRSDGVPFVSARAASMAMQAASLDAVSKSLRNKGTCAGYTFQRISLELYQELLENVPDTLSSPKWTKARTFSDAVRNKISETKKGTYFRTLEGERSRVLKHSRPVLRSDGQAFESLQSAGFAHKVCSHTITRAIKNKTSVMGFTFVFIPKNSSVEVPK